MRETQPPACDSGYPGEGTGMTKAITRAEFDEDEYGRMVDSVCKDPEVVAEELCDDEALLRCVDALGVIAEIGQQSALLLRGSCLLVRDNASPTFCHDHHMYLGFFGELGELANAFKRAIIYRAQLDRENVIEEAGDLCWYLKGATRNKNALGWAEWVEEKLSKVLEIVDVTLMDAKWANYQKLVGPGGRYEHGYSNAAAEARRDKHPESDAT